MPVTLRRRDQPVFALATDEPEPEVFRDPQIVEAAMLQPPPVLTPPQAIRPAVAAPVAAQQMRSNVFGIGTFAQRVLGQPRWSAGIGPRDRNRFRAGSQDPSDHRRRQPSRQIPFGDWGGGSASYAHRYRPARSRQPHRSVSCVGVLLGACSDGPGHGAKQDRLSFDQ